MSIEFLITSLVVVLLPGAGVIYTLTVGLGRGFKASVAAAVGCTLGIVPAALACIVGLAALLHTSALAFQAIKYLGVLYLFYMAWKILRDDGLLEIKEKNEPGSYFRIAANGTLLNILNPKLSLFFLAFLPQFISHDTENVSWSLAELALVFMLMTLVIFILYGAFAAYARDYVIARPRVLSWLKRSFAGSFGVLGIKLALPDR